MACIINRMKISIYKIYNDEMAYIGSSQNYKTRMCNHKTCCYNENRKGYNYFIYQYIRTHGGWDAFTKEIIHECDVADKDEQRKVEQEWIDKNECKLNDRNSYQTKEEKKEQQKQRYETNKDKINDQRKQKITCECGSIVTRGDRVRHERTNKHKKFIAENNIFPVV